MGTLSNSLVAITEDFLEFARANLPLYTSVPNYDRLVLRDAGTGYDQFLDQPQAETAWMKLDFLHTPAYTTTLGVGGEDEQVSILQIALNYPLLTGQKALYEAYDLLRNHYVAGKSLTYSGTTVKILRCGITEPVKSGDSFRAFVSIEWRVRHVRPNPLT